jgi:hypothetical protein
MLKVNIAKKYMIVGITVTTSVTPLTALIKARLDALSKTLFTDPVIQVTLTPASAINVVDPYTNEVIIISAEKRFPLADALDKILLSCDASTVACSVELFFD